MENISKSQPYILRGTYQQTSTALLYSPPTWVQRLGSGGAANDSQNLMGVKINSWELHNRSGGVASVGIGFRLHKSLWKAGTWTDATTTFTEVAGVKVPTANSLSLSVLATANDGFAILSAVPFDFISMNVTTADAGTVPTYVTNYSGPSGWAALPANSTYTDTLTTSGAVHSVGEIAFVWQRPFDWSPINVTGAPAGMYGIRVRATTPPGTTVGKVGGVEIGTLAVVEALADNAIWEVEAEEWFEKNADAVVAYFSTANGGNRARVMVETL